MLTACDAALCGRTRHGTIWSRFVSSWLDPRVKFLVHAKMANTDVLEIAVGAAPDAAPAFTALGSVVPGDVATFEPVGAWFKSQLKVEVDEVS